MCTSLRFVRLRNKILPVVSISVLNKSEIKWFFSPKENSLLGSLGCSSGFLKFASNLEMVGFFVGFSFHVK